MACRVGLLRNHSDLVPVPETRILMHARHLYGFEFIGDVDENSDLTDCITYKTSEGFKFFGDVDEKRKRRTFWYSSSTICWKRIQ